MDVADGHELIEYTTCLGVGDLISGSWELTQRIFENLSFREVARLRPVCKLWADVGAKILERRRKLHYLTVHPHHIPTTEGKVSIIGGVSPAKLFDEFFEHIVSKPRYCIGFCNEDWIGKVDVFNKNKQDEKCTLAQYVHSSLPSTCDFRLISASGIIGTVEQSYQGHMLDSANTVNQELLSILCSKQKEEGRRSKRCRLSNSDESFEEERQEALAANESSSSEESGCSEKKSSVGYSIEVEARWNSTRGEVDAATLLLIPHHPGVKLKFFELSEESFMKEFRQGDGDTENLVISTEEFNGMTGLSVDDDMKSLLLFDVGVDEGFTSAFLQAGLLRQNQKLAIGGGVVECYENGVGEEKKEAQQTNLGIAICGKNVMAASVLIPKYVGNTKALDEYMKQLKSCGLPEGQSLALIFTCCGRGYSWYRRRGNPWFDYNNVETKAFRKVFPNTPVFGFFGGGEIGLSFLPKFNKSDVENEEGSLKKRKKKLFHQFTTIIVLLSFL